MEVWKLVLFFPRGSTVNLFFHVLNTCLLFRVYTWSPLTLSLHSDSALQVVKAFIVLTPEFLSHDRDQLTKELQQHVKSLTAPYKHPRKVSEGRGVGSGPCQWALGSAAQISQGGWGDAYVANGMSIFLHQRSIQLRGYGEIQLNERKLYPVSENEKAGKSIYRKKIRQEPRNIQEGCHLSQFEKDIRDKNGRTF